MVRTIRVVVSLVVYGAICSLSAIGIAVLRHRAAVGDRPPEGGGWAFAIPYIIAAVLGTCWLGATVIGVSIWRSGSRTSLVSQVCVSGLCGLASGAILAGVSGIFDFAVYGLTRPGVLLPAGVSIVVCRFWPGMWRRRDSLKEANTQARDAR